MIMNDKIEERITHLERKVYKLEIDDAVMVSQFTTISSDIKEIKGSQSWVIKLIVGALILAIIGFITGGGLGVV